MISYSQLVFYTTNEEFLQVSNAFLFGFPITWDELTGNFFVNKPSGWRIVDNQHENTFDPSFQMKTVIFPLLRLPKIASKLINFSYAIHSECVGLAAELVVEESRECIPWKQTSGWRVH